MIVLILSFFIFIIKNIENDIKMSKKISNNKFLNLKNQNEKLRKEF